MSRLFATRKQRALLVLALVVSLATPAACAWLFRTRVFTGDAALDGKTYVAPSRIPGAGNGLFAARDLKEGEVIAEMGGRLVFHGRVPREKRGYLFAAPSCARWDLWPYDALDGTVHGGRASRINFAPGTINGRETGFQNARGTTMCRRPYVAFRALREIPRDEEILTSYGQIYDYGFMEYPAVQDHFCKKAGVDCTARFDWEP
jgi:hypothetical protein